MDAVANYECRIRKILENKISDSLSCQGFGYWRLDLLNAPVLVHFGFHVFRCYLTTFQQLTCPAEKWWPCGGFSDQFWSCARLGNNEPVLIEVLLHLVSLKV